MTALLSFREAIRQLYAKYDTYMISIWKFLLAIASFLMINGKMGFLEKLDSIFIVLILALFCSFLPVNAIVLASTALILGHLYGLSLPALIVGGGILIIVLLLYFGTVPQTGYVLVVTMLALALGMPCMIPLVFGLISGPVAAAAICFGTVSFYTLRAVTGVADMSASAGNASAAEESKALVENVKHILESVLKEEKLVLMLITMIAVLLVVYLIRRMAVKHAWTIAIGAGTLTFLSVILMGSLLLGHAGDIPGLIIGTAFSVMIAFGVKFFLFHVDYSRTMNVQFEDGDYYYYVKAIPKIKKGREERGDD